VTAVVALLLLQAAGFGLAYSSGPASGSFLGSLAGFLAVLVASSWVGRVPRSAIWQVVVTLGVLVSWVGLSYVIG
jgi:hypothetical protein